MIGVLSVSDALRSLKGLCGIRVSGASAVYRFLRVNLGNRWSNGMADSRDLGRSTCMQHVAMCLWLRLCIVVHVFFQSYRKA